LARREEVVVGVGSPGDRTVCVSDEFLDRLGDLYQKYAFQMTFEEFLEMVLTRLEERYGPSRARHSRLSVALTEERTW
jgi:hypothetical protein